MKRIKLISEPTELVPILRAMDTKVKREVFKEVSKDWCALKTIEEKYGKDGKGALLFFEKVKLVETKWASSGNLSEKLYHTYYTAININAMCNIMDMSEILSAATLSPFEFRKYEKMILGYVNKGLRFVGEVAEKLDVSPIFLKALIKRSEKIELKGHRIESVTA